MDIKYNYFFTLGVRPAEINGLKELPKRTKDEITPVLLLAPWLATTPLSRALDKFEAAYPSRPYFIDVDTYYQVNDRMNDAKALWQRLRTPPVKRLEDWWELLEKHPNANPCLLMAGQPIERVRDQMEWARKNDRYFCLRLNLDKENGSGTPSWMKDLVDELAEEGVTDYTIILEFGWVEDALQVMTEASGYISDLLSAITPPIPVVVSCTSFPNDFKRFDGIRSFSFANRDLIAQLQQVHNRINVVYGDWGSTRPRNYSPASPPKNRIDYPMDTSWVFARDQDESIDFEIAARRITESQHWNGNLGIWGEKMIEATATGQSAIYSMPKMYAARINIHLHRQAFYGNLPSPEALDEPWSDDEPL